MIKLNKRFLTYYNLLLLGYLNSSSIRQVYGFAYAPNFITKIITESTGLQPQGLLEIDGVDTKSTSIDNTDSTTPKTVGRPITTRFPPEPNGYLHLGHAKAISFNFAVARMFPPEGRCHMRLDDTNPSKEDQEYVDSILEDVRWIQSNTEPFGCSLPTDTDKPQNNGPWYGPVRYTSDYFDLIHDCAVSLIKSGDAYVDNLSAEEMRAYRGTLTEPGKESPYRGRSVEENLDLFQKMRAGEFKDGECVLRAKIDMASPNINMRDPALFRIKHESHPATGDAWCIYPMYDFSHPISDAIEGITHSLCTLEFEDHRPFYDWTLEKLLPTKLITAKPQQIEFSRLNLKYTVLSKRKLIQLVEGGYVNGWDDPRMPTLSGSRRRGVPAEGLRLFCERVGISKSDSFIDAGELENCVREVMDASSRRAFAVLRPLKVTITNWEDSKLENFEIPRHPKIESMGQRIVPFGKELYIERSDFFDLEGPEGKANGGSPPKGYKRLLPNGQVRLKYAYVITCNEIIRDDATGEPIELKCTYIPETRAGVTPEGMSRVKGIIQWVEASTGSKCKINQYDRLFQCEEPGKETGNFLDDLNPNSLEVLSDAIVEPSVLEDAKDMLRNLKEEQEENNVNKLYPSMLSYQFERNGYFALDSSSNSDTLTLNRVVTLKDTWEVSSNTKQNDSSSGKTEQKTSIKTDAGPIEDARRVAFRAGTILEAKPHPDADTLVICQVDCGDEGSEIRTVVAGLGGKIPLNDLVGKKIAMVTNLKPSKMRGVESTAMLLAASSGDEGMDEKVELLNIVSDSVQNGELLYLEGKEKSEPDGMMKSKGAIKAFERVKASLKVNDKGEAIYVDDDGGEYRMMSSEGPVTVASLRNVQIG